MARRKHILMRGDRLTMVPTHMPMTSALCEEIIRDLTRTYPGLESQVLTTTAYGRPVQALRMGQGERRVLYTAAHHGNEWITASVLLRFAQELAQADQEQGRLYGVEARNILNAATIYLVPMVNPDGVDLVTGGIEIGTLEYEAAWRMAENYPSIPFPDGWKANLLGVDLNLQYPAGWLQARETKFDQGFTRPGPRDYVGRAPLNQRETIALASYTDAVDPALVLAYHTQGQVIYWTFRNYEVPGARKLGEEFARLSGYTLAEPEYASSFAGYKDWFIQNFRRPGYTIEAGSGINPLPIDQLDQIYRDNLGILVTGALGLPEGG